MKNDKAIPKKSEIEKITCEKDAETGCPVGAIKID
jgi:ferredoxin